MHATHITLSNTKGTVPDVGVSNSAPGVESALSGWMTGCTSGTQVTRVK